MNTIQKNKTIRIQYINFIVNCIHVTKSWKNGSPFIHVMVIIVHFEYISNQRNSISQHALDARVGSMPRDYTAGFPHTISAWSAPCNTTSTENTIK